MTILNIIEGKEPNCPQDWIDLFEEYRQFMDCYNPKNKEDKQKKILFCLTHTGHEINLQWLDEMQANMSDDLK